MTAGYDSQPIPAIEGLSMIAAANTLTHLAGANGSGKTTVLELCSGYLRPWGGEIRVRGLSAESAQARKHRRICRTQPAVYPQMTVDEHLRFAARCFGAPVGEATARATDYGLDRWSGHEAKELSTGSVRKLWIVMTTLGDFDVVLLDEPFNGLDTDAAGLLEFEIGRWRRSAAVVLICHDLPAGSLPDATVTLPSRVDA